MKKKVILIIIIILLSILDIFLFWNYIFLKYKNKSFIEKTDVILANEIKSSPFKINKIILYSSGYGKNTNTKFQSSNWILDIYEYTDIALYVDAKDAIKTLTISNFKSNSGNLYYLDSSRFGTEQILENFEIAPSLDFTVLNDDNKENLINFNTPIFFADGSNPITLKYVNTIAKNFVIENNEKLEFDGSLLKRVNPDLNSLKQNISFDVTIANYNNEKYSATINLNIPIENNSKNIFNGSILETINNQSISLLKIKNSDT